MLISLIKVSVVTAWKGQSLEAYIQESFNVPLGYGREPTGTWKVQYLTPGYRIKNTQSDLHLLASHPQIQSHACWKYLGGNITCTLYARRLIPVLPYSLNIMVDPVICMALGTVSDRVSCSKTEHMCGS